MADPVTIAGIGMGAQAGGSLLSFLGAKREGAAQQQMFQYQSGIAQLNKKIALQNRDYALAVGEEEAGRYGMKARATAGTILARQGASGIDVGGKSSTDVRAGQHQIAEMDLATIRNNAARRAYGYTTEAAMDDAQSGLYEMAGSNAKQASKIKAAGSLISGVAGVSDKWLQAKSVGLLADRGSTYSQGDGP